MFIQENSILKKKLVLALLALIFFSVSAGIIFLILKKKQSPPPKPVHFHAGFQVYVDGTKQDFSALQFMNLVPCSQRQNQKTLTVVEEQEEKAHLHDGVGDVVHVHRQNATWWDLFQNIRFSFDRSKEIEGYIDGKKVNNILQKPIVAHQSVIIVIGDQSHEADYEKNKVTLRHIKDIESHSETCGSSSN